MPNDQLPLETEWVWGPFDVTYENAVFLPRSQAEHLAALNDALRSRTWGEMRAAMAKAGQDTSEWLWDAPPDDTDPFNPEQAPGYSDGQWPPMFDAVMAGSLPKEIVQRFGRYDEAGGTVAIIDPKNALAVVAELAKLGYRCTRDDDLISRTFGPQYG